MSVNENVRIILKKRILFFPKQKNRKALSAFFTKPHYCNVLIISASLLKQKARFSEPYAKTALLMSLNIR